MDKTTDTIKVGIRDAAGAVQGAAENEGPIATAVTAVTEGVESAQGALSTGWESAQGALSTAATAVADGWESAQGTISTAATAVGGAVGDGVESASAYLQEKKFEDMATDLTALIRSYPVPALLVGVGLGYLLARLTTR